MHPGRFRSISRSLQVIVARGTVPGCFEGVAVVQAVCAVAPGRAGQDPNLRPRRVDLCWRGFAVVEMAAGAIDSSDVSRGVLLSVARS